jgi:hypothetical protein
MNCYNHVFEKMRTAVASIVLPLLTSFTLMQPLYQPYYNYWRNCLLIRLENSAVADSAASNFRLALRYHVICHLYLQGATLLRLKFLVIDFSILCVH